MRFVSLILGSMAGLLAILILLLTVFWALRGSNVFLPGLGLIFHIGLLILPLLIIDAALVALAAAARKLSGRSSGK
jgi:hypothetical protein